MTAKGPGFRRRRSDEAGTCPRTPGSRGLGGAELLWGVLKSCLKSGADGALEYCGINRNGVAQQRGAERSIR